MRDTGLTGVDVWAVAEDWPTWRALRPTAGYVQQWVSAWFQHSLSVTAKIKLSTSSQNKQNTFLPPQVARQQNHRKQQQPQQWQTVMIDNLTGRLRLWCCHRSVYYSPSLDLITACSWLSLRQHTHTVIVQSVSYTAGYTGTGINQQYKRSRVLLSALRNAIADNITLTITLYVILPEPETEMWVRIDL